MLHRVTRGYGGLQRVTGGYLTIIPRVRGALSQEVTKGLQRVTRG